MPDLRHGHRPLGAETEVGVGGQGPRHLARHGVGVGALREGRHQGLRPRQRRRELAAVAPCSRPAWARTRRGAGPGRRPPRASASSGSPSGRAAARSARSEARCAPPPRAPGGRGAQVAVDRWCGQDHAHPLHRRGELGPQGEGHQEGRLLPAPGGDELPEGAPQRLDGEGGERPPAPARPHPGADHAPRERRVNRRAQGAGGPQVGAAPGWPQRGLGRGEGGVPLGQYGAVEVVGGQEVPVAAHQQHRQLERRPPDDGAGVGGDLHRHPHVGERGAQGEAQARRIEAQQPPRPRTARRP